jgi:hypothetical protein
MHTKRVQKNALIIENHTVYIYEFITKIKLIIRIILFFYFIEKFVIYFIDSDCY